VASVASEKLIILRYTVDAGERALMPSRPRTSSTSAILRSETGRFTLPECAHQARANLCDLRQFPGPEPDRKRGNPFIAELICILHWQLWRTELASRSELKKTRATHNMPRERIVSFRRVHVPDVLRE